MSDQPSAVTLRALDPHDDADMDGFQEVYVAAELAEDPDAALYSREDGIALLTTTESGTVSTAYGAFLAADPAVMVGETLLNLPQRDNLDVARIWVWVDPAHQRRGIGTLLAARAHADVARDGRHVHQATCRIGPDRANGNRAFAEGLGYTLANVEIERRATLPADAARLARLEAEAAPHHAGYEIRTVIGPVPDGLAASYVAVKNLLAVEAPGGDLELEAGQDTVTELAAQDRMLLASGRARVASYALAGGEVVAYSAAATSNDTYDHVDQWGTLVHPAHRGHRLGMAVKCGLMRALSDGFPTKRYVQTSNAETNDQMVAINVALGFEVAEVYGDFQLRLD